MLILVQARTSSKRFPRKILHEIQGKPLILHVIEKLKKSNFKNEIVVSTSIKKSDNELVALLKKNKIKFYRGNLKNVAERLLKTALKQKKNYFVRVSGDSPVIDTNILDRMIRIHNRKSYKNYDIITNVFPKTFPKGMSFEIIKRQIIINNLKFMSDSDKEHVTQYFYNNSSLFRIKNLFNFDEKKYKVDLTVDKKIDLKKIEVYLKKNV